MADSSTARSYRCTDCEVTWRSTDPACWACGVLATATVAPGRRADATRSTPGQPTGTPLTRWGRNVYEAHALGLPDPRAPRAA